jgi:hypothetical protein
LHLRGGEHGQPSSLGIFFALLAKDRIHLNRATEEIQKLNSRLVIGRTIISVILRRTYDHLRYC